jgi:hypothetical protein
VGSTTSAIKYAVPLARDINTDEEQIGVDLLTIFAQDVTDRREGIRSIISCNQLVAQYDEIVDFAASPYQFFNIVEGKAN